MSIDMKLHITFLVAGVLCLSSCNESKFLHEDPPTIIYPDNLYNSYSGFVSGMNAVYANMRKLYMSGDGARTHDQLWTQNTDNVSTRTHDINQFRGISSGWAEVSFAFEWLYEIVNSTNLIISCAENNPVDWQGNDEAEKLTNKNNILGQAYTARAWAYRLLMYAFGPVPLNTKVINGGNYSNAWERAPIEDIKIQMEADLKKGVELLDLSGDDQCRINGAFARHFLGELYLSMGNFKEAESTLRPLCESSYYSLVKQRFGRKKDNPDGNYFIDMFRNPYRKDGNTESIFIFANGLNVPGAQKLNLMNAYIGEYHTYKRMGKTIYWWDKFGGQARCRYHNTPYAMSNEDDYNLYYRNKDIIGDPNNPQQINKWLWKNEDGRDNFLYENKDIRGQHTSIRRFYVDDWNGDGDVTDPCAYPLDKAVQDNSDDMFDEKDANGKFIGDTCYTFFTFEASPEGSVQWHDKHTYVYSRKWEVEQGITAYDLTKQEDWHTVVHLRLADSYLLFAEALFMQGKEEAVTWINKVRSRAGASEVSFGDLSIDFILDERSRELVDEELRKITLLRTGKYLERTKKYNPLSMGYVKDFHKLAPIPSSVIDSNKDKPMDQNLGFGGNTTCDFTPNGYQDE